MNPRMSLQFLTYPALSSSSFSSPSPLLSSPLLPPVTPHTPLSRPTSDHASGKPQQGDGNTGGGSDKQGQGADGATGGTAEGDAAGNGGMDEVHGAAAGLSLLSPMLGDPTQMSQDQLRVQLDWMLQQGLVTPDQLAQVRREAASRLALRAAALRLPLGTRARLALPRRRPE